eukprot:3185833-Pleurochrysis_carterae.AAC.1
MGAGGGVEVAEDGFAGVVGGVLSGSWSSDRGTVSSARRCDAMTRAKRKFRSGGYAECCREVHPSSVFRSSNQTGVRRVLTAEVNQAL